MLNPVTHAVIPVAGLGTRVLPASKSIAKEMMPVVDKPVIQYVVEEAINAGITNIVLVTRSGKSAIEDHFDSNYELESVLKAKSKSSLLQNISNIIPFDVNIITLRQHQALGLGHAVLCAAPIIGNNNFAVLLPDMLIPQPKETSKSDFTTMMAAYQQDGIGQIMVEPVPKQQVERYGIVDCAGKNLAPGMSEQIIRMVEKPSPEQAPSNLSINGRYILPARIMELLKKTKVGAGGEIQLTDALAAYLQEGKLEAFHMQGKTYDCGNKVGYLEANIVYGLRHPETSEAIKSFIKELVV